MCSAEGRGKDEEGREGGQVMSFTRCSCAMAVATLLIGLCGSVPSAFAETPALLVSSSIQPKSLPPGGSGEIVVSVSNVGDANTSGSPIVVTDTLPAGLKATKTTCGVISPSGLSVTCTYLNYVGPPFGAPPDFEKQELTFYVTVSAEGVPAGAVNVVSVAGGGARRASSSVPVTEGLAPEGFGVEKFEQVALNEDGSPDTQAGSHPFEYITTVEVNKEHVRELELASGALVKDLRFNLPAGLVGNPTVIPQCTTEQFYLEPPFPQLKFFGISKCTDDAVVGVAVVELRGGKFDVPLFNLVPASGEPARFGFKVLGVAVFLDTAVRSGGDYGVVVSASNISNILPFDGAQVTFWGVPSDPRHGQSRGFRCLSDGALGGRWLEEVEEAKFLGPCPVATSGAKPGPPFLTLPTSCTGPLRAFVEADSWGMSKEIGPHERPGEYQTTEYTWQDEHGQLGLDGCNHLPFEPSIDVTPDGPNASSPTGLSVREHVPQEDTVAPTGLAESTVKNTTVALPVGVQVSPAGGDGLLACSEQQVGFGGPNPRGGLEFSDDLGSCPEASKVGTVRITTPLLPNPLTGAAYLASQNANPFGSLVALYIIVHDPVSGVLVKAAGEVKPDPVTGQLVTTFKNTPQLPYENLELHFFGSARAPLTTPPLCGTYTTTSSIEGWSGNAPSEPSSSFQITAGPGGGPCSDPQPFAPGFAAGSTNLQAAAFTPFTLTMTRPDADQTLSGVELYMPPGLLGTLSTVKLCGEPQAAQGTCGPESLIGETTVAAGLGDSPYTVRGGKVYITTGYKTGAYGLSIVNPAKAGPFDLGTVVVRASVNVEPHTAALTIKSDPLPTILDGIPLQIQHVNVSINRDKFTFNPTNCNRMRIGATLSSTHGATAPVSTSFQVTNCATLGFKPNFAVSTSGKTSRENGASLYVKLTYPNAHQGSEADIAAVKVELPRALPSRLKTLQKACLARVFETNPADCPAVSMVGRARATTPIVPVALEGPAYFVSHGGESFPSLILVLQGYGTTVDIVGSTFINKAGITSSTFSTIPDVPVGMFELTLPQGPFSALAANGNLCKSTLIMPTLFESQNGIKINQSTRIHATGCATKVTRKQKGKRSRKAGTKRKGRK